MALYFTRCSSFALFTILISATGHVKALVQELVQMRTNRHGSKALVFSQFVNFLDLVRWRLHSDPCLQGEADWVVVV